MSTMLPRGALARVPCLRMPPYGRDSLPGGPQRLFQHLCLQSGADFLILFSHNTCPCQNLWNRAESSQMDSLCLRIRKYQPCTPNLPSGTLPVHLSPMYCFTTCFQLPWIQALVFLSQECLLYSFSLIIPLSVLAFYRRCLNIGP